MSESIRLKATFPVSAKELYSAWLDSTAHSDFTGGNAVIEPVVGSHFDIWDGYITGTNLELCPYTKIVQSWRTDEFPEGSADSRLELMIEDHLPGFVNLEIIHTNIPDGQAQDYCQGWMEYYIDPMRNYFTSD